jgi:hypothetical protein
VPVDTLTRLEILAGLGAGLGSLAHAALLATRADRTRVHGRVAAFVGLLGAGMALRALHWATGEAAFAHLMLLAFALFPLPLALYFETLLARPLDLPAKLLVLAGTLGFATASFTHAATASPDLGLALVSYHTVVVAYLGVLAAAGYRRAAHGPRRSLIGASLAVCALAVPLMATDWLVPGGVRIPRLGALPVLLALFFGGASLHTAGEWSLRARARRLGATVVLALLLAGVLELVRGADGSLVQLALTAAVLAGGALAFEPLRHYLAVSRPQRPDLLLTRLSDLRAHRLDELVAAVAGWPELERVQHLRRDVLGLDTPALAACVLAEAGGVITRAEVRQRLARTTSGAERLALEQLDFVMDGHRADHLALLDRRGDFLAVSFAPGCEPAHYRPTLAIIAALGRLSTTRI